MAKEQIDYIPQLDINRLARTPGNGSLRTFAVDFLQQKLSLRERVQFLKESDEKIQELFSQALANDFQGAIWWLGTVENIIYAAMEFEENKEILQSVYEVTPQGLYHRKFGYLREFAIENVKDYRPEIFNPIEAFLLEWAEKEVLKKPGIQVGYAMSCGCNPDLNKIIFLNFLTRSSQDPDKVISTSYRIGRLNVQDAQDLLSYLAQDKEGKELVTQEVIDENGQKHNISLLITDNEEAFIKEKEEIDVAKELLHKVNQPLLTNTEPFFVNPELFKPFFPQSLPLWPRVELPSLKDKEEKSEFTNHEREGRLLTFTRPSRELPVPLVRNNAEDKDHFRSQEKKRKVLPLQSETQRVNREVNYSQSEAPLRIRKNQTLKEKADKPIEASESNQEVVQAKVAFRANGETPLVISSQAEIRVFSFAENDLRQEIQLPQEDYLPLLEISQTETSQQEFLNEPQSITIHQEELATQEAPPISALETPLAKDLEVNQRKAQLEVTHLSENEEAAGEKVVSRLQDQSLAAEQEEDIRPEAKIEISVEPPEIIIKSPQKTIIEIPVSQPPKKKEAFEFLPNDLVIEPEKDSDSKAKKVIERIEEHKRTKRQTPLIESPKTPERRLKQSVFNWRILIPKLRLEAERPLMDLSLAELVKELITVPSPKTSVINLYEQRESKFSQAILLHSLSGIYVTNQKTWSDSIPPAQVIFDSRWLPKVIYEAKDPLPVTDLIVPIKRKVIKADEYQEVVTIDDLTDEEVSLKFLFLPLPNQSIINQGG